MRRLRRARPLERRLRSGTPQAERRARAVAANRVLGLYGLRLAAWADRYTLSGRTGRSAVVDHLGTLWPAAERLTGAPAIPSIRR